MTSSGTRSFFAPADALRGYLQFGFALPGYRPRDGVAVDRFPTARATIYYAEGVASPASGIVTSAGLFCEGPHATAFSVAASAAEIVAFKVKSGALRALLGVPASELKGRTVSLVDVWGRDGARLADRMAARSSPVTRARLLAEELLRRTRESPWGDRDAVALAARAEGTRGHGHVADLVDGSGYSRRALIQKFQDCVGLSPKEHLRILRLRESVARIAAGGPANWTEVAAASGYCDQSHLIHDFRDLLGRAPSELMKNLRSFDPVGGIASGRQHLPRCEQRLYHLTGLVTGWLSLQSCDGEGAVP